jgi:hypothetical protein
MKTAYNFSITDHDKARVTAAATKVGTYFAFTDGIVPSESSLSARLARLLVKPPRQRAVIPMVGGSFELPGVRITPADRGIEPLSCLVSDRDLYRAEQDTAYVFVALPAPPDDLSLELQLNGATIDKRKLTLGKDGVCIEPFPMLLAGSYTAQLRTSGRSIGSTLAFTVAEYSLAPLSGRLAGRRLDRAANTLHFTLDVESWQVPLERVLRVALVENGRERAMTEIAPSRPGVYSGSLPVAGGDDALLLRLSVVDDAARIAEVAIPGSRRAERETTLVSELGREQLFSLMPDAGAIPVRGGYLSEGDYLSTPLVVESVHTRQGVLRAQADLESLTLAILDLASGSFTTKKIGDVKAGQETRIDVDAPVITVIAGCWVAGSPFEGMTSFFRPVETTISVSAPEIAEPKTELPIRITVGPDPSRAIPVLLSVRDRRLTVTDTPEAGLAAAAKRGIAKATEGMAKAGITPLEILDPISFMRHALAAPGAAGGGMRRSSHARTIDISAAEFPDTADYAEELESFYAPAPTLSGLRPRQLDASSQSEIAAPSRTVFPEVLFYGLLSVRGETTLSVPLGDSTGTFDIDVFALSAGDWVQAATPVVVDQALRVDLDAPPAVHPEDNAIGRLRASSRNGRIKVSLKRDGVEVPLIGVASGADLDSPVELSFALLPGRHAATVTEIETGKSDTIEIEVGTPGRFRSLVRELGFLQAGETMTLDSANALSLRILPGLERQMGDLVDATANYAHLCCEQTAAKILAAAVMFLSASDPAKKLTAESIVLSGIAREKKMWRKGKGFSIYPEQREVHSYYSPLVVRHLWTLSALSAVPGLSKALAAAVREGMEMADDVAKAFKVARAPDAIHSIEDAYAAASAGPKPALRAKQWVEAAIDFTGPEPRARAAIDKVRERVLLAYGAAILLTTGDLGRGIHAANRVMRQLNDQGRLYSTVDSVAAIALMTALARAGVIGGGGKVKVNGTAMDSAEAARLDDPAESIETIEGVVPVEVTRLVEEDWSRYSSDLPVKIGFRNAEGGKISRFAMGDRVDLSVSLPGGAKAGDLLHVALPAGMSWISGGARVKKFSRDFEGNSEITVPLVVTGRIEGKQRFAVCVRNMFEEERAASPGVLTIGN